jgi:predicted GIY-YIG superfamily endonuclease
MPIKIIDYTKTIFYKIVCNDLNIKECYIGHTTNFRKRKNHHKTVCNNENNKGYNIN